MSELVFGEGSLGSLAEVLVAHRDPILVVTGRGSFEASGAASEFERLLSGRNWTRVVIEARLPGFEPARAAVSGWDDGQRPDVVLAVGGGTVIDVAKLIALLFANEDLDIALSPAGLEDAVPIVAIPTTAGSGSERTPFAVAYDETVKFSVEHPSLQPRAAIVDPNLTHSMSADLTASTGLDVIAHAIESGWAASATEGSVGDSVRALEIAWSNIDAAVTHPDRSTRRAMAEASTLAGQAIAVARTTASHALSYYLTANHGVAHGVAAAVTLGAFMAFNAGIEPSTSLGRRTPDEIRSMIRRWCEIIGADDPLEAPAVMRAKLQGLGVMSSLTEMGVTPDELPTMVDSANPLRLSNNPRLASSADLLEILTGLTRDV